MQLIAVDAAAAAKLQKDGALVVDVREALEFASGHIPGSRNVPLSRFARTEINLMPAQAVVFVCTTGKRTSEFAAQLAAKAGKARAYTIRGGVSSWMRAGFAVETGDGREGGHTLLNFFKVRRSP